MNVESNPSLPSDRVVAVLGYGSQGRAHALNLRDAGRELRVGLRPGGPSTRTAHEDGFAPLPPNEAVRGAGTVVVLVPDLAQAHLCAELREHLEPGALVLFAHGFCVHYGLVELRPDVDVGLVAPKSPGALVRREFELGRGVPCLTAVHQDHTCQASARVRAYAEAIGGGRAGIIETSFGAETETDLFGEQAVLCGGVTELVTAGFDTLVDAGYPAELAYFECLHELKLIVDLLHEGGLQKMHAFVSETAIYGDLTRGPRIVDDAVRVRMRQVLDEIRSGEFAREWIAEYEAGSPRYGQSRERDLAHPIEAVGARLRARMPWLDEPPTTRASAATIRRATGT